MKDNQDSAGTSRPEITEEKTKEKTFTQEEVNNLVSKRLSEEKAKSDERNKQAIEEALKDYDRKAKMTEEERRKELLKAKDDELAEKERNITLRENRADAVVKLAELNIDTKMVDFVVDLDKDKMNDNITKLNQAFSEAVTKAVEQKLAGKTPTDYGDGSKTGATTNKVLGEKGYRRQGVVAF